VPPPGDGVMQEMQETQETQVTQVSWLRVGSGKGVDGALSVAQLPVVTREGFQVPQDRSPQDSNK
jgi:hypothetical protein